MRSRTIEWVIVIIICALALALCIILTVQKDSNILPEKETSVTFSRNAAAYLKEHDTITIAVDKDMQYLIGGDNGGYLQEYMQEVLKPAGLKPEFTEGSAEGTATAGEKAADGCLMVVTDHVREQYNSFLFTAPLCQMEGALFIRERNLKKENPNSTLKTVLMKDRISERKQNKLTYRDHHLDCEEAETARASVHMAKDPEVMAILGDRSSVISALQQAGMENEYIPGEQSLYTYNICIRTETEKGVQYEILNQCIQNAQRHDLSYDASIKWLEGDGPVYLKNRYEQSFLPVLIIMMAVLIAFFLYYLSNRNMYQELDIRMDKIRASQNEMQTTFHNVGHYLAELTPEGEIIDLNRAFLEDAGVGALHASICDAIDLDEEGKTIVQKMVDNAAQGSTEEHIEMKVGKRIFVMDVFPIADARGRTEKLLFMAIDVTQERMAKRQMLQDNKMIAIGQLAAGVAHEIRNPLGIIRNYCYVLKNMEDEEVRTKAIAEIEKAVDTSGRIINNLLDFSRVSPGRTEEIDVEEHLKSLMALNDSTLRAEGVKLEIVCRQPIRTYMALEPFNMIILNLITNAMDAMADDPEGGKITITVDAVRGQKDKFEVRVEDTGIGISEDALEEIFNPFYSTKGNKGTGLGLYIVYSEIEKLGGEIDVSSRLGEGTEFVVTLPIRQSDSEDSSFNKKEI